MLTLCFFITSTMLKEETILETETNVLELALVKIDSASASFDIWGINNLLGSGCSFLWWILSTGTLADFWGTTGLLVDFGIVDVFLSVTVGRIVLFCFFWLLEALPWALVVTIMKSSLKLTRFYSGAFWTWVSCCPPSIWGIKNVSNWGYWTRFRFRKEFGKVAVEWGLFQGWNRSSVAILTRTNILEELGSFGSNHLCWQGYL